MEHNIDTPGTRGRIFSPPAPLLITIDGPAGAGKTTVSRMLADCLSYGYIDTGALYRGIAYQVRIQGIQPDDDQALKRLCGHMRLSFADHAGEQRLFLDGVDISDHIRTREISMLASVLSARRVVRKCLLQIQRRLGQGKGVVFEGRDMGTVVFPDADVKFFLGASLEVRARRRYAELTLKDTVDLKSLEKEIRKRDANDSSRVLAPLAAADDALVIDSTDLSVGEVVDLMITHIRDVIAR